MAFHNSGRIVTNGLVLSLDAADQNSYTSGSTTWFDLSGNNYTGSLTNGPTFSNINGGSIVFDGINDYVNLGSTNQLTNLINITTVAWVYPITGSSTPYISRYFNTTADQGFVLASIASTSINNVKFSFAGREDSSLYIGATSSIEYPLNNWYNIVGIKSSNTWSVYVNGTLVGSLTAGNGTTPFSNNNLQIGALVPSFTPIYAPSRIAITQIYNRALSAQEVLQNYNAQKSRFNLT